MTEAEADEGYSTWGARALRAECRKRGLRQIGSKADLISRLERHDEGDVDGEGKGYC